MSVLKDKGKAIRLEDCECIGMKISEEVNGERVSKDLKEIFDISGVPTAIIKDTNAILNYGVNKFIQESKENIAIIDDITHIVAKALKKEFEDRKSYKEFTKLIKDGSARIRNTDIAFLTPPKLRNKARIESLFGKFKYIIERSPQSKTNHSALIIPALCGKVDEAILLRALDIKHKDLKQWEQENIGETMRSKRRSYFDKKSKKQ